VDAYREQAHDLKEEFVLKRQEQKQKNPQWLKP
jgi:hypothetical protein